MNLSMKSAAQRMLSDFEETRGIPHNPTKGRARESIVFEEFLRPYLPGRFSVGTGLILDSKNQFSKQQDLVIYDALYSPLLKDLNQDKVFFPESVLAVLEVKSHVTGDEIADAVEKSISVWGLTRAAAPMMSWPGISLVPIKPPVFCMAIGFESSMDAQGAIAKMRELRSSVPGAHALSLLCILQGQQRKPILIVSLNRDNLHQIVAIPNPDSPLGAVDCETPGDALLYAYLILMEHLGSYGPVMPGPNLIAYAQAGGLGVPQYTVPPSEMAGTYFDVNGKKTSTDAVAQFRLLTINVVNGQATDAEILNWFYLLPQMPFGEKTLDPQAVLCEVKDGLYVQLPMPQPRVICHTIERHMRGTASEADETILRELISLIRSVFAENRTITICAPQQRQD